MRERVDPVAADRVLDQRGVGDVAAHESHLRGSAQSKAGGEVVEDHHLVVAGIEQRQNHVLPM